MAEMWTKENAAVLMIQNQTTGSEMTASERSTQKRFYRAAAWHAT
jgi:hypothetical protein